MIAFISTWLFIGLIVVVVGFLVDGMDNTVRDFKRDPRMMTLCVLACIVGWPYTARTIYRTIKEDQPLK